jgi:hypothetical protein
MVVLQSSKLYVGRDGSDYLGIWTTEEKLPVIGNGQKSSLRAEV